MATEVWERLQDGANVRTWTRKGRFSLRLEVWAMPSGRADAAQLNLILRGMDSLHGSASFQIGDRLRGSDRDWVALCHQTVLTREIGPLLDWLSEHYHATMSPALQAALTIVTDALQRGK